MKHEKLKELSKKRNNFFKLAWSLVIPACLLLIISLAAGNIIASVSAILAVGLTLIASISGSLGILFAAKGDKYDRVIEDYIIIKVMDILNTVTDKYEVVYGRVGGYRVGFHNQIIDYEDLQSKIDAELNIMNKISNRIIRVKLI